MMADCTVSDPAIQAAEGGNPAALERSAAPILKWPGGKRRILADLIAHLPPSPIDRYVEPFVGGGALFFGLARLNRLGARPQIADVNPDLIATYRAIAADTTAVSAELEALVRSSGGGTIPSGYYRTRAAWNADRARWAPARHAATMIFLNRTCFNGLWRVNSNDEFNVPIGTHKTIHWPRPDELAALGAVLARTAIICASFQDVLAEAAAGDAVYCDPPYLAHRSAGKDGFTAYSRDGFGAASHAFLALSIRAAVRRGARVLVSQGDSETIRRLYRDPCFRIYSITAPRSIAAHGGRGPAAELLIHGGY